jgi:predicted CXXCH cytochrome family protein
MTNRAIRAFLALGATLTLMGGWRVVATIRDPIGPAPPEGFESMRARASYRTSQTCQVCHADHVVSWRRTFHRTMTRDADRQSIRAPFDGRTVDVLGVPARPWRTGDSFFLDLPDPGSQRIVSHRIERVTGSRRMQQFETREDDRYIRLPLAWSIDEQRWLHLSEAFFHPDGDDFHAHRAVWDLNCIFCHTTRPVPGLDSRERLASRAAELGIACEACHGPGEEHARRMRSPLRRYAIRLTHPVDPTIVNPGRIEQKRSVEVCGHCHGQRLPVDRDSIRAILSGGDPYTPGEELSRFFEPVGRDTMLGSYSFAGRFWPDGSPRLTAYEFQGVLASPCYLRGTMTCLSCHTMHAGDPRGQMRPDLPGDAICTQCHAKYQGSRLAAHSGHRVESTGSRCIACHMPPVVYGIMTWHPTHRISSPDPAASAAVGAPDACTVCHSGRSVAWAALAVGRLWPRADNRAARQQSTHRSAPELVHTLFEGDAVYRTLSAFRFGEPSPDPEVSARIIPLLAELLVDPYPNVRRTAREALIRLTGRKDLPQALDPIALRDAARRELQAQAPRPTPLAGWPFTAAGELDRSRLAEWQHERHEVDVSVGE